MISSFINVAVAVNDIEASVKQFQDAFGFELEGEIHEQPGLNIKVAVLQAGGGRIELLSPLPGETILRKFLDTRGEGLYRLAFGVDDMDSAVSRLDEKGVRYMDLSEQAALDGGKRIVFTSPKASSGVMMELVEGGV